MPVSVSLMFATVGVFAKPKPALRVIVGVVAAMVSVIFKLASFEIFATLASQRVWQNVSCVPPPFSEAVIPYVEKS